MQVGSNNNITFVGSGSGANTAQSAAQAIGTDSSFSFWDALDIINPLQHIPILSTLYREATGDTIKGAANIIGSTLFGGPIGGAVAVASEIAKGEMNGGSDDKSQTALADNISDAQKASNAYKHIRITTADWLNPNFSTSA